VVIAESENVDRFQMKSAIDFVKIRNRRIAPRVRPEKEAAQRLIDARMGFLRTTPGFKFNNPREIDLRVWQFVPGVNPSGWGGS